MLHGMSKYVKPYQPARDRRGLLLVDGNVPFLSQAVRKARNAWRSAQSEGTLGDGHSQLNWLLLQVDMELEFLRKLAERKREAVIEVDIELLTSKKLAKRKREAVPEVCAIRFCNSKCIALPAN